MSKLWKAMKEKRRDKNIKKLGKEGLHYVQENEKLERHIANLRGGNAEEMMKNIKTGSAKDQGQPQDTVTREKCNAEGDTLQEGNTPKKEKASAQLRNEARQLMTYVTPCTLLPGQEKQWYQIITERVQAIPDMRVTEILSVLLPHIVYHPEIEKRLRKQLEKSEKESFDKTIVQCLNEIMKGYISQEELLAQNKDLANSEKLKENTSTSRDNDDSPLISSNFAITSSTNLPESIRKADRPIKKRCRFCKKRGHTKDECLERRSYWNWKQDSLKEQGKPVVNGGRTIEKASD